MASETWEERIANAMTRAQTVLFAVFSAAVIVAVVVVSSLAERQSASDSIRAEMATLTDIANRSENAIRELRRYMLLRMPSARSDETAVLDLIAAVSRVAERRSFVATWLESNQDDVPIDELRRINRLLTSLIPAESIARSVYLDYSPHGIVPSGRLEETRLRDLVVLTNYASADAVSLMVALDAFATATARDPSAAVDQLRQTLEIIDRDTDQDIFSLISIVSDQLRSAIEQRSHFQSLAVGGLWSNYNNTVERVRELEDRLSLLSSTTSGEFQIEVPIVDLSLPSWMVVLLFPMGLIIGFGLVAESLAYTLRQLVNCKDLQTRANAADLGVLFAQLVKPVGSTKLLTWIPLVGLQLIPIAASVIIVDQYFAALGVLLAVLACTMVVFALLMVIVIFHYAWEISRIAAKHPI